MGGGAWTICRFKGGGLARKRREVDTSIRTMKQSALCPASYFFWRRVGNKSAGRDVTEIK